MLNSIIYLGFNDFRKYKRGVENVVDFQRKVEPFLNYYIHFGDKNEVYRWDNRLLCISIKKSFLKFFVLNYIVYRLRKRKKVVVHSHNPLMSFLLLFKTTYFTVHDSLYYQNKALYGDTLKVKLFSIIEKIVYKRSLYVHFISQWTKNYSLYPKNGVNFEIIYNTSAFENKMLNVNDIDKFKYPFYFTPKPNILIVRSIEPRAKLDLIFDVAKIRPEYNFIVVGKGPLLNEYREKVLKEEIANLYLLGYLPDDVLLDFYSSCDCVAVPASSGEGFGLPVIEGYLFNKPVIASNIWALPEVIFSKEYLFDNNIESISTVFDWVLSKNSIDEYKKFYDLNYSNKIIYKQYHDFYSKCI